MTKKLVNITYPALCESPSINAKYLFKPVTHCP